MFADKIWKIAPSRDLKKTAEKSGILPVTAQVLFNRGVSSPSAIKEFLNPGMNRLDDYELPDVKDAAAFIKKAVKENKKIVVYGDFDVDGITSTALLYETLKDIKADVSYYIPCRFKEGYGLNAAAIKKLSDQGCGLLITVDCGITAHKEIAMARKKGMDVIVTDHHQSEGALPEANYVINPVLHGKEVNLAGVAVAYLLARELADDPLEHRLELVALGSITDMVPLEKENRVLVSNGLKHLRKSRRPGLAALSEASGIGMEKIESFNVGYQLGPRLNAGGRMADAYSSLELLLTQDSDKAENIALELDRRNRDRQEIEKKMLDDARQMIEHSFNPETDKAVILVKDGWHDGVKGIVASRIQREYCRPAFVCTLKDGKVRGSGRSFGDLNLKKTLDKCSDLLQDYGGHPAAAGITLKKKDLKLFSDKFNSLAADFYKDKDLRATVEIDAEIKAQDFGQEMASELSRLRPFGIGNSEPLFCVKNAYMKNEKLLGDKQIKVMKFDLQSEGKSLPAIAFTKTMQSSSDCVDACFTIDENEWQGKKEIRAKVAGLRLHRFSLEKPDEIVSHLYSLPVQSGRYENIAYTDSFYTKVAGVSFEGRQELLGNIKEGERLVLIREPENPHDPNAIRVDTAKGLNIGFLNRELASKLSPHIDLGVQWSAEVSQVTGGSGKNYGVNIIVQKASVFFEAKKASRRITDPVAVKKILVGDVRLHPKQKEALDSIRNNQNTLLIMGTGRGKSAVFHLHSAMTALNDDKITIVLYPLRSLIRDQFLYLEQAMAKIGLKAVKLTGESGIRERREVFASLAQGQSHIVLTTPEFLFHNREDFERLKSKIGFFVVDEAHHLKTASAHHRPVYRLIHKVLPKIGNPTALAATATAGEKVSSEIIKQLDIEKVVIDPTIRKNLYLEDCRGSKNKEEIIAGLIAQDKKTVIYTNSRKETCELAERLRKKLPARGQKIVFYHAGLKPEMREMVQDGFTKGVFQTIVATSAFGEGVNIPDIENLVLYHMPFNTVQYNQQCGRAGRNNERANIHLLFGAKDAKLNDFILENICPGKNNLRTLFKVLKAMSGRGVFMADNKDILAECESMCLSGFSEKGIASSLKVFEEIGLIEVRREDGGRVIELTGQKKADLENSALYQEAMVEKAVFAEFKKTALQSDVSTLLEMFNQPIYPRELAGEGVLQGV